jgi:hypothetical protein
MNVIVLVTLIWNTVKLWCRKNEREAMRRPGVIAYLTEDEAITAPGHGRLAEVPLERLHELSIALSVIQLDPDAFSSLFLAGKSRTSWPWRNNAHKFAAQSTDSSWRKPIELSDTDRNSC